VFFLLVHCYCYNFCYNVIIFFSTAYARLNYWSVSLSSVKRQNISKMTSSQYQTPTKPEIQLSELEVSTRYSNRVGRLNRQAVYRTYTVDLTVVQKYSLHVQHSKLKGVPEQFIRNS